MQILTIILLAIYAIIGGLSTLYLLFGMPAVFIWKCYRKFKYNIALTD